MTTSDWLLPRHIVQFPWKRSRRSSIRRSCRTSSRRDRRHNESTQTLTHSLTHSFTHTFIHSLTASAINTRLVTAAQFVALQLNIVVYFEMTCTVKYLDLLRAKEPRQFVLEQLQEQKPHVNFGIY